MPSIITDTMILWITIAMPAALVIAAVILSKVFPDHHTS